MEWERERKGKNGFYKIFTKRERETEEIVMMIYNTPILSLLSRSFFLSLSKCFSFFEWRQLLKVYISIFQLSTLKISLSIAFSPSLTYSSLSLSENLSMVDILSLSLTFERHKYLQAIGSDSFFFLLLPFFSSSFPSSFPLSLDS